MVQWLGSKGLLCIHEYTVVFATQKILSKQGLPYKYEKANFSCLKDMTQDQLDFCMRNLLEIQEEISAETFRRIENDTKV